MSLDEDRILRSYLDVTLATLRTNFFQGTPEGGPKPHLSFKLDPSKVPGMPEPRPMEGRWNSVVDLEWVQGTSSFVVAAAEPGVSTPQLWQITYPDGQRRRITNDLNTYSSVSLSGDARSMVDEVGAIANALGTPPPLDVRTLDEAVARARGEWDVLAALMVVLAAIASVVAAVGVYGVVGFSAAARRAEFGIRMALGASTMTVRGHIVRTAAQMTAAALLFGLAGGLALVQALRARLVGVSAGEPAVWAAAAVLLVVIVAIASIGPVRQSARTSLAETLRAM